MKAFLFPLLAVLPYTLQADTDKVADTPDLCQTDPAGGFDGDGSNFCAPVSISNSLLYLAKNGFPDLIDGRPNKATQIELVRTLAQPDYLATDASSGTDPARILHGLSAYLQACGYSPASLEYQGWRSVPNDYNIGETKPDLDWLRAGIDAPGGAVWLNVGWYRYDSDTDTYSRYGGHWVALVGYGLDSDGNEDNDAFIVHNPIPAGGLRAADDVITFSEIGSGTLNANGKYRMKGLPRDARGYYEIEGAFHTPSGYTAILDDAIVLDLGDPPAR